MSFGFGRLWELAFGPAAPTPIKNPDDRGAQLISLRTAKSIGFNGDESDSDDEDSGPDPEASKPLRSTDTLMDVNSQILEISHRSVLARTHPPPFYRGRQIQTTEAKRPETDTTTEAKEAIPIPAPVAPVVVVDDNIEVEPPGTRTLRAVKTRRDRWPWYKRIVRRKKKSQKGNADSSRRDDEQKTKKTDGKTRKTSTKKPKKSGKAKKKLRSIWRRLRALPAKAKNKLKGSTAPKKSSAAKKVVAPKNVVSRKEQPKKVVPKRQPAAKAQAKKQGRKRKRNPTLQEECKQM